MDLLQIGITVALSTVANQAGKPLIRAGYNQISKRILRSHKLQSIQHYSLCDFRASYKLLLLPVILDLDLVQPNTTDLLAIYRALQIQQKLKLLTSTRGIYEHSNRTLLNEDIVSQTFLDLSNSFSQSDSNLILPNRDGLLHMCSCVGCEQR